MLSIGVNYHGVLGFWGFGVLGKSLSLVERLSIKTKNTKIGICPKFIWE